MDKDYVKENLKLIRNPDDVNFIITTKHDKQAFIVAGLTNGREVHLTHAKSSIAFSGRPMYDIAQVMGLLYMEDFVSVCEGFGCINRNNFESVKGVKNENPKYVDLIVKFKNGKLVNLYSVKEKHFEKEKARLEALISQKETDWTERDDDNFLGL